MDKTGEFCIMCWSWEYIAYFELLYLL